LRQASNVTGQYDDLVATNALGAEDSVARQPKYFVGFARKPPGGFIEVDPV
jgi:hypothetical protein